MEQKYGNPDGVVPSKGEIKKDNYKNVIFRNYKSTKEIIKESKSFDGIIIDDHLETESCEIFSSCGE